MAEEPKKKRVGVPRRKSKGGTFSLALSRELVTISTFNINNALHNARKQIKDIRELFGVESFPH